MCPSTVANIFKFDWRVVFTQYISTPQSYLVALLAEVRLFSRRLDISGAVWMSHVTRMSAVCADIDANHTPTHCKILQHTGWVMSHIWMSHVTHMSAVCADIDANQSWCTPTDIRVLSGIQAQRAQFHAVIAFHAKSGSLGIREREKRGERKRGGRGGAIEKKREQKKERRREGEKERKKHVKERKKHVKERKKERNMCH